MSEKTRVKFANYMHENYGSLIGNLCFGMLLGITGVVGYLTHLPLDISSCGIFICKCGLYCRERTFYLFIAFTMHCFCIVDWFSEFNCQFFINALGCIAFFECGN